MYCTGLEHVSHGIARGSVLVSQGGGTCIARYRKLVRAEHVLVSGGAEHVSAAIRNTVL